MPSERRSYPRAIAVVRRLVFVLALADAPAFAQVAQETEFNAAIVFNFALFTQWPDTMFGTPESPLELCVVGEEVPPAFAALVRKTVQARPVKVRRVAGTGALAGCHVAYWNAIEAKRSSAIAGAGTLTVGNDPAFLKRGGIIQMQFEGARVVFEVSLDAARAAGLRLSSRVLRLAKTVHGSGND